MQPVTIDQQNNHVNPTGRKITGRIAGMFRKHRKKKIAALILLVVVIIAIYIVSNQEHGVVVSTGAVSKSSFEQNIFASGKLDVKDKHEFYADSKTVVDEIMVEAGQKVSKDQLILRTDSSSLALEAAKNLLAYDEIRTRLVNTESTIRLLEQNDDYAQKEYDNAVILFENGAISQKELDDAERKRVEAHEKLVVERDANLPLLQSQLSQARLVHNESEKKLQKATVKSPIDGVLLSVPVKKGQEVQPGSLLAQIGDPDHLQIETGINEIDAAQLKVGDKVVITNSALLAEPLNGSIAYIAPIAEAVTTSQGEQTQVKITVAVEKTKGSEQLKPGFNVNIKVIVYYKDDTLVIPLEALVKADDKSRVFVVDENGIVAEREVQTGASNELFTEIISGLSEGEKLVLNPGEQIKSGVKVIVHAAS